MLRIFDGSKLDVDDFCPISSHVPLVLTFRENICIRKRVIVVFQALG